MAKALDFEQDLHELELKIEELTGMSNRGVELDKEIDNLQNIAAQMTEDIYKKLTPWQRTLVARHAERPHFLDYIKSFVDPFHELHGDRYYGDDGAIVGGLGRIDRFQVVLYGHQKGRDVNENIKRNFGMANPEGYRKALRLAYMAEKFSLPIVSFVDTPAAYPGKEAEERGQAEAIARNLRELSGLRVPIVVVVIGEGGSGGALGIGIGDHIAMLENAVYQVCPPEACSSILWKDASHFEKAAEQLRITATDLKEFKVIDEIIPEPDGGLQRKPQEGIENVRQSVVKALETLTALDNETLMKKRQKKIRSFGTHLL